MSWARAFGLTLVIIASAVALTVIGLHTIR